jgi:hypothetical protein
MKGYGTDGRDSIPDRGEMFVCTPDGSHVPRAHPASCPMGSGALSPEINYPDVMLPLISIIVDLKLYLHPPCTS